MMKIFLLATLAMLFAPAAQAQSYRSIVFGGSTMIFVLEGSMDRYAGMGSVTILMVTDPPQSGVAARQAFVHFSCQTPTRTYSLGNFILYNAAMDESGRDPAWTTGAAGATDLMGGLYDFACNNTVNADSRVFAGRVEAARYARAVLGLSRPRK